MIRVGPAGWSYADWEGIVYPRKKPPGFHPLSHLARSVTCLELNSTFYALPRREYAERWCAELEPHPEFRITAKLLQAFTHDVLPPAAEREALAHAWLEGVEPLRAAGRLAGVLVQFPVSFRPSVEALDRLESIDALFGHLRLVLEVRHREWFMPDPLRRIEALGYSLASIDLPAAKDHPPEDAPVFGPLAYLRVHGRNADTWFARGAGRDQRYDYLYGESEVDGLVRTAKRLAEGSDETYVITNNHFSGKAVVNALEILASLGDAPLAPVELVHAYPRLKERVRVSGQDLLF